jgi:N6-adenosine-specific RNA methylase IME4
MQRSLVSREVEMATSQSKQHEGAFDAPAPRGATIRDLGSLLAEGRRFPAIYADPPWSYRNEASRAAAINHYPTLTLAEICALPIAQLAAENAHLHLWATTPLLAEALTVIQAWGFRYKSCFVWIKDKIGMGNYWRVSHEFLLLGVRGNLRFRDRTIPSWLKCRRTQHSRKPEAVRLLIERISPGPYLELFGRAEVHAPGWTVFGNQIERRLF